MLVVAEHWKQPKYPLTAKWLSQCGNSPFKRVVPVSGSERAAAAHFARLNHETVMLSEKQKVRTIYRRCGCPCETVEKQGRVNNRLFKNVYICDKMKRKTSAEGFPLVTVGWGGASRGFERTDNILLSWVVGTWVLYRYFQSVNLWFISIFS